MKLFRRRRKKEKKSIDDILEQVSEDLLSPEDMQDDRKVHHYVLNHCELLIDTAKELEEQKSEYRVVTSYLKDIQMIEEMPEKETGILRDAASNIVALNESRDSYLQTTKKINDLQYAQMEQDEEEVIRAIQTLQSNEMYQAAVKRDMQYLEGEKTEWIYYRQELLNEQKLMRRLAYILFGVFLMLMSVILVLRMGFFMDVTYLFILLVASGALGGASIFVRMQNNRVDIKKAEANTNRAIILLNKAKIKYVNSTNAIDYTCEKYHVKNSYELNYIWEQYMEAKREKEKFERASDDLDYFNGRLVHLLKQFQLYDAKVWVSQPQAIVDKREMVEIKHNLLERRKKLRGRIEYNMDVVLEQKEEIEKLMKEVGADIPEVKEIIASVNKLCGLEN